MGSLRNRIAHFEPIWKQGELFEETRIRQNKTPKLLAAAPTNDIEARERLILLHQRTQELLGWLSKTRLTSYQQSYTYHQFHGRRGELRQKYREGKEDQLGALGLILYVIVYWNALYIQQVVDQIQKEDMPVNQNDLSRALSLLFSHINMNGKYTFTIPKEVKNGELRPLRGLPQDSVESLS